MERKMKKLSGIMLAVVMIFALAGCGSEDTGAAEEESQKEEQQDQATVYAKIIDVDLTTEEYAFGVDKTQDDLLYEVNEFVGKILENGTLDEIIERYFSDGEPQAVIPAEPDEDHDQLVVATSASNEPFEYTSGESYYGIDMEIAQLLADELGQELVIRDMDFDNVLSSVAEQECDIAMAGLTITDERKDLVNFSTVYYDSSLRLIVPGDETAFDDCTTSQEVETILNGMGEIVIGVQSGTTAQTYVEGLGNEEEDSDAEDGGDAEEGRQGLLATCETYKNGTLAVQDMVREDIRYVIMDADPALAIVADINGGR